MLSIYKVSKQCNVKKQWPSQRRIIWSASVVAVMALTSEPDLCKQIWLIDTCGHICIICDVYKVVSTEWGGGDLNL